MSHVKYLLAPGWVTSSRDGRRHFVGVLDLIRLYNLKPGTYRTLGDHPDRATAAARAERDGLVVLYPRANDAYTLDQPHIVNAVVSRQHGRWGFGARLHYATGNPTPSAETMMGQPMQLERLPDFFAIDLRFDRAWHRPWGTIVGYVDLTNVTNHDNHEGPTTKGLPILPFLGVAFRPD